MDNYDSFTFNITNLLNACNVHSIAVIKNDKILDRDIEACDLLIISPGPDIPQRSGRLMEVINAFHDRKPIFGICLGFQALGIYYGATLKRKEEVAHGLAGVLSHVSSHGKFMRSEMEGAPVGLYHSWMLSDQDWPLDLQITSRDEKGVIMSFAHKHYPVEAVQFHPESFITEDREDMMKNYLDKVARSL